MFNPHGGERLFDVFKVQEETEDKLVTQDSLARDNKREGKLDSIIKCQRINCYAIESAQWNIHVSLQLTNHLFLLILFLFFLGGIFLGMRQTFSSISIFHANHATDTYYLE